MAAKSDPKDGVFPVGSTFTTTQLSRGLLSEVIDRVGLKGETIFIARKGRVIAKLVPSNDSEAKVISDPYLELLDRKAPPPVKGKR